MPSINSARYAQRIIQTENYESPSFLRKVHRLDPPVAQPHATVTVACASSRNQFFYLASKPSLVLACHMQLQSNNCLVSLQCQCLHPWLHRCQHQRTKKRTKKRKYLYPGPYAVRTKSQLNKQAKHTTFYKFEEGISFAEHGKLVAESFEWVSVNTEIHQSPPKYTTMHLFTYRNTHRTE